MTQLSRRQFLQLSAASAVARTLHAQTMPEKATFTIGETSLATVPLDFTGLSYESPQIANPEFFSADNTELVQLFRELGPTGGVLRTGGNLSAFTCWRDDPSIPLTPAEQARINKGKRYWEWALTDPSIRNGNHEAVFTPASVQTLAAFLDATGWKLLYGLNFAAGTPDHAAAEAACVHKRCGTNLLAFQLGNELDFWAGGFRAKNWDFDTYYAQWREWVRVIRATTPDAPMAGPDVAMRLNWMEQLAGHEGKKITLLTKHHYAMGPAGDPRMEAHHLLCPDPDVAKEVASAQRAKAFAGVGFRNSECNSCFHGGQPGVSDAYASALWGADYMLTLAQGGHLGVNLHGGGNGIYSPITGDKYTGFTRAPLFFGMKFAQQFAGSTILDSKLSTTNNVTAYAARQGKDLLIALINKDAARILVEVRIPAKHKVALAQASQLHAPRLDSKTNVRFEAVTADLSSLASSSKLKNSYSLAPYSALLLRYR